MIAPGHPATPFIADFVGSMNFLKGIAIEGGYVRVGPVEFTAGGALRPDLRDAQAEDPVEQDPFLEYGLEGGDELRHRIRAHRAAVAIGRRPAAEVAGERVEREARLDGEVGA